MYQIHKFMLTPSQLKKVKRAIDEDKQCSLTIPHDKFNGDHPLPVTEAELKHVQEGDGYVSVSLSKKKLQHIRDEKEGGFLPLLAAIPWILGGLGAAGSLASGAAGITAAVNKNKTDAAALEEQSRHNKAIENKLDKTAKSGAGVDPTKILVCQCPACGCTLKLKEKQGKGLYLRPYNSGDRYGTGLIYAVDPVIKNNSMSEIPDSIKLKVASLQD